MIKRPLCPYCRAEWTDEMITFEDVSMSEGCDTCGYGSGAEFTLDIHCHKCKKLIYRKEGLSVE